MRKYTFFDTESAWDEALHEGARHIDPSVQAHHRIGSKRIFAAACFDVTVTSDGAISCDGMASWTERDYGDEREIVDRFFNHLRARTDRTAIGFGSVATDLPLLQLAAMEYSLQLPGHFLAQGQKIGSPVFAGRHFDLGLAMKGSGRTWHHLSEVILRLGLPAELMTTKKHVQFPTTTEGWADAVAHVELDCALLSVAHLAWSRAQGQAYLNAKLAALVVLEWLLRNRTLTEQVRAKVVSTCAELSSTIREHAAQAA